MVPIGSAVNARANAVASNWGWGAAVGVRLSRAAMRDNAVASCFCRSESDMCEPCVSLAARLLAECAAVEQSWSYNPKLELFPLWTSVCGIIELDVPGAPCVGWKAGPCG